ncbi:MAG: hypothetical protein DHS20C18_22840 [Saprospiraceae bacterium]|nr:MAG: hypothetical protein DHS20C18_22840 [Saprospiraceae bacterium]
MEKEVSLEAYQVEAGFGLEVIASEPLIESPVAIDFDEKGRLWVVEMTGYMTDIDGTGEDEPSGKIVILSDTDHNGKMDHQQVFLEGLVVPRALLLAYGGLLYVEPPNLWFVEIENDLPVNKTLVDSTFVLGGNIEHQPNALMMNLDNWIYSANSNNRYKKVGGQWIREHTLYRGQWGLTKDVFGRLFYNNNANQLQGDFVLPNSALNNPFQQINNVVRQQIVTDQRIYPIHASFINRGYIDGELDEAGKPTKVTSACGPVIYQGSLFSAEYEGNGFVCIPEGNLIKRNILSQQGLKIKGRQAWQNKEFLTATDQAFRPVNLFNGPDGALYVVDMHRGVIQHRAYMSPYLREKIEATRLDTITGMGRILRIAPENHPGYFFQDIDKQDSQKLVDALSHPNVWVRDKAQQFMVQNQRYDVVPALQQLIMQDTNSATSKIHALWTLEGLYALTYEVLEAAIKQSDNLVKSLAFHLLPRMDLSIHQEAVETLIDTQFSKKQPQVDWYMASVMGQLKAGINKPPWSFYLDLAERYQGDALFAEAALSSLHGQEASFLQTLQQSGKPYLSTWKQFAKQTIRNKKSGLYNRELKPAEKKPYGDKRQVGLDLYRTYCSACHGDDGHGIKNLAPPLYRSEFISGPSERLALIILHGLQGPLQVDGVQYNFNAAMPGMANNPNLSDEDILSIMHFVRNAFSVAEGNLTAKKIKALRQMPPPGGQQYTAETLPNF